MYNAHLVCGLTFWNSGEAVDGLCVLAVSLCCMFRNFTVYPFEVTETENMTFT
jgi:hypothetical protein